MNNGRFSAVVSSLGAELRSFRCDGNEYLWHGDPRFWDGRSPLLFPITGRVWDNRYRHLGKEYTLTAHGFARHREFAAVDVKADSVTFGLHSDEDTLRVYPFAFFLFVTYRLTGEGLEVRWFVRNEGDTEMYFQIGAHPALNLPGFDPDVAVRGYFSFDTREPIRYFIPVEKGCVDPSDERILELDSQGMLPITDRTFDIDTYVIESADIHRCTLLTADRVPYIDVEFDMPVLALWAPTLKRPDCPFVCIEPWTGSCDTVGYEGEFADRRHMSALAPGAHFTTAYSLKPVLRICEK